MVGGLHPVRVPSSEEEALRDLVRAREDVRGNLMRARHRLSKLLLRHEVAFEGPGANWALAHREWLGRLQLADRGAQLTLLDYLGALDMLIVRREGLEATIGELLPVSPWRRWSRGCAAYAASTCSRRSSCARRTVTSSASRARHS